jgi:Tfp pilus assembly protein PilF
VLATVYAAKNAVAPVQASVEGRGLALTPDLVKSSTRMSLSLDLAREYLEQKQFAEARENLQIADGEARKILRYVGL